jgi:hypothetical protein
LTIEKALSQFPALSNSNRPATAGRSAILAILGQTMIAEI